MVPVATRPPTPAPSKASRLVCSAATSTWSSAVNGVIAAGMIPGNCMGEGSWAWGSVERHVAARAVDVLGGVLPRGLGIAFGDRRGDEPVLGQLEGRAAGDGDRVVAELLPERLVHQRGEVVGDRE